MGKEAESGQDGTRGNMVDRVVFHKEVEASRQTRRARTLLCGLGEQGQRKALCGVSRRTAVTSSARRTSEPLPALPDQPRAEGMWHPCRARGLTQSPPVRF